MAASPTTPSSATAPPVVVDAEGKVVKPGLEPALIQKIVRGDFDRFRKCYEAGLGRNRELQGKVTVKFEIDLEGHVTSAEDVHSTMPDAEVVRCVIDGYRTLRFPKPTPTGKPLTVVYPIVFNPGD